MAIDFPSNPSGGSTYSYEGVTYTFKNTGGSTGFWQITGPGTYGVASTAEVDAGTNATKYLSPDSMEGSKYSTLTTGQVQSMIDASVLGLQNETQVQALIDASAKILVPTVLYDAAPAFGTFTIPDWTEYDFIQVESRSAYLNYQQSTGSAFMPVSTISFSRYYWSVNSSVVSGNGVNPRFKFLNTTSIKFEQGTGQNLSDGLERVTGLKLQVNPNPVSAPTPPPPVSGEKQYTIVAGSGSASTTGYNEYAGYGTINNTVPYTDDVLAIYTAFVTSSVNTFGFRLNGTHPSNLFSDIEVTGVFEGGVGSRSITYLDSDKTFIQGIDGNTGLPYTLWYYPKSGGFDDQFNVGNSYFVRLFD